MLLDTSFLIDLQRELAGSKRQHATRLLAQRQSEIPWISLFTWMEFAEGYTPERYEDCILFLSRFQLILPDRAIAWRASRISRQLRKQGRNVGDHDIWIAATALEGGMPVVTRNAKHFEHLGELQVLTY
jgi:tRNA(fMet)-specific endonuclease VapC